MPINMKDLQKLVTIEEASEGVNTESDRWKAFVSILIPSDELWLYERTGEYLSYEHDKGYAIVRNKIIVGFYASVGFPPHADMLRNQS